MNTYAIQPHYLIKSSENEVMRLMIWKTQFSATEVVLFLKLGINKVLLDGYRQSLHQADSIEKQYKKI